MIANRPPNIKSHGLSFEGISIAGVSTCIVIPEIKLSFDVAQGYPWCVPIRHHLITHGHQDHAGGIAYLIGQKALFDQPKATFYMLPSLIEPLTRIVQIWQQIENHHYEYKFVGVQPQTRYNLQGPYFFRIFTTIHRVISVGYTVFEERKKLKTQYQGLSSRELVTLKTQGIVIDDRVETPLVSFTGDTQIEFIDESPEVRKSRILFVEVTNLDEKKNVHDTRKWGHIHLDELISRLPDLECEKIVLIHLSKRYSYANALEILAAKIPPNFRQRVVLFPFDS